MDPGSDDSATIAPSVVSTGGAVAARRRLTTGTVLQDRYRIVGALGSGGMGDVYRAEDLKLEQPVALKFLPPDRAFDPVWLARFHNEVRVARQVSHPAVCRIFDIGQIDGEHFLSMEYVDGEDLSSLLRRIGRLPPDKGLEIARQLCAGVAAAHDIGVLHRDLKPANVMIDGRGRVKITDFGLAEFAHHQAGGEVAGTPAYMAPEVLRGEGASVASDVFGLGLVLYEVFTGKTAYGAETPIAARRAGDSAPTTPSEVVRDIDPAIERVILRCLDADAKKRPSSALAVSAALPGGDPLAAALAAGETPSPEMVAAAGSTGALSRGVAWALAAGTIAAFVFFATANSFFLYRLVPFEKPPEILAEHARELLGHAGLTASVRDRVAGFTVDEPFMEYIAERRTAPEQTEILRRGVPPAVLFWYRQAPVHLTPAAFDRPPTLADPPLTVPGMASIVTDTTGRLIELTTVPPRLEAPAAPAAALPWATLFADAGLDQAAFAAVAPAWNPPVYADARAAWEGAQPGVDGERLRVEAASYRGQVVWFKLVSPWTTPPSGLVNAELQQIGAVYQWTVVVGAVLICVAATLLARRNLRNGRGDRRGAFALAAVVFCARLVVSLFSLHHVPSALTELLLVSTALAWSFFSAGAMWVMYLALEPFVRRRWPDLIISWTRLLSGQLRDPLVGRDVLIGAGLGGATLAAIMTIELVGRRFGQAGLSSYSGMVDVPLFGLSGRIALAGALVQGAINVSLVHMFLLTLFTMTFRRRAVATALFWFAVLALGLLDTSSTLDRVEVIVSASVMTLIVVRFGLLALSSMFVVWVIAQAYPMTLDPSVWYAGAAYFAHGLIALVVGYALYTCLGGKPFAGMKLLEDS